MDKTKEEHYNDLLNDLKQSTYDKVSLLGLSNEALKLVSTWRYVEKRILSIPKGNKALHECWHYTWFDDREWARLANVVNPVVWEYFNTLAKSNVIYPDGTMPDGVMEYLMVKVEELFDDGRKG